MATLENLLQQLRAEHSRAQLEVEKLGQAISAIESLNGSETNRSESFRQLHGEKWLWHKGRGGRS